MKTKLFLFVLLLVGLSACTEDPQKELAKKQKTYYLNEDFVLVDRKETQSYNTDRDKPVNIRTWVIHRVSGANDSIEVAEIMSESSDCGCQPGDNFAITDELWYGKKVGDKLHFDFIRKDRFFKVKRENLNSLQQTNETLVYTPDYPTTTTQATSTELDFDKERQIMEIERKITDLQRELDNLKK